MVTGSSRDSGNRSQVALEIYTVLNAVTCPIRKKYSYNIFSEHHQKNWRIQIEITLINALCT